MGETEACLKAEGHTPEEREVLIMWSREGRTVGMRSIKTREGLGSRGQVEGFKVCIILLSSSAVIKENV